MEVLVFKTNLRTRTAVWKVVEQLCRLQEIADCTVDLSDCDKVLRVEATGLCASRIIRILQQLGFQCEELE